MARMESFTISLSPSGTITGLLSFPPTSLAASTPLLVCVHGSTYSSTYFDASPSTSIASLAQALKIPVVCINRPNYGSSTPPGMVNPPEGSTYLQEEGKYMHSTICPALWKEFSSRTGANCMVLYSHSLGSVGAMVAASLHSSTPSPSYPLAGLFITGVGVEAIFPPNPKIEFDAEVGYAYWDKEYKDLLMLNPDQHLDFPGLISSSRTAKLHQPVPLKEVMDIIENGNEYWKPYAKNIKVPVGYALGREDKTWKCTEESVQKFLDVFEQSEARRGTAIMGAPHCIELSIVGRALLVKILGFAIECGVAWDMKMRDT